MNAVSCAHVHTGNRRFIQKERAQKVIKGTLHRHHVTAKLDFRLQSPMGMAVGKTATTLCTQKSGRSSEVFFG